MLGPPDTVVDLGETEVSEEIFMEYLSSLGESAYRFSNFFQAQQYQQNSFTSYYLAHVIVMNRKHYFMISLYTQFHIG